MDLQLMVALARSCVGVARYSFYREHCHGLAVVNCFTLPCEVAAACGVVLPRDLCRLLRCGRVAQTSELHPFDLVLSKARWGGYSCADRKLFDVGHLSLATGEGTVIDASRDTGGVIEFSARGVLAGDRSCGVIRLFG